MRGRVVVVIVVVVKVEARAYEAEYGLVQLSLREEKLHVN